MPPPYGMPGGILDSGGGGDTDADKKRKGKRKAIAGAVGDVGRKVNEASVQSLMDQASRLGSQSIATPAAPRYMDLTTPSFKRGGTMRRRGVAKLHKGERIKGRKKGRGKGRQ